MRKNLRKPPSLVGSGWTESQFRAVRRQKFLTYSDFTLNELWLDRSQAATLTAIDTRRRDRDFDPFGQGAMLEYSMRRLRLRYTAGVAVDELIGHFTQAADWFARWHIAHTEHMQSLAAQRRLELRPDLTPVTFDELEDFQQAVELVSLGALLGQGTAIQRACDLLSRYRGEDMLFESIVEPAVNDIRHVEEFYHATPYDPLLDAVYTAETGPQASQYVKKYLDNWYKSFEGCTWHDGHLKAQDYMTPYYGYWSFEAAAICVIHNIDDSPFRDHLVYPKVLADWARANNSIGKLRAAAEAARTHGMTRMRCEGGQPCPQAGFWFTTALASSRRHFDAGTVMPEIKDSPWGATVWYWHEDQKH
ncbi:MAG: DUF1911 domain-containing protein [Burkholderiales bacterium]|nr:DUF1911 domain-containing protein [Burkholderiales bacterium]